MNKKLLVVIDMQNDFITGALGNKECQAVVPAVAAKVKSAEGNANIVYTLDTHGRLHEYTGGKKSSCEALYKA